MFGLGTPELILILAIVLLLFGGTKLPELSRSLGEAIRELRKGFTGSLEDETDDKTSKSKKAKKK